MARVAALIGGGMGGALLIVAGAMVVRFLRFHIWAIEPLTIFWLGLQGLLFAVGALALRRGNRWGGVVGAVAALLLQGLALSGDLPEEIAFDLTPLALAVALVMVLAAVSRGRSPVGA